MAVRRRCGGCDREYAVRRDGNLRLHGACPGSGRPPAGPRLRLSSILNSCPRKAVYEATGAPARERGDREERWLFRGRRLGRDYADLMAHKYGADKIERERKVIWPLGTGHIDVYLKPTRTAIEVLSSAHATGLNDQTRGKLLQLVGYMEHDPGVDNGALVILNPSDYSEERIILVKTSAMYADLRAEMSVRLAQVYAWRDTTDLPARVCGKPSDAISHFCLHESHCFDGWEPPALEELAADDHVVASLAEYQAAHSAHQQASGVARILEKLKKEAKERLEHAAELPVAEVQVGPFRVKRTIVQRADTFQWAKAEAAGVFEPGMFSGDFWRQGAAYSQYAVERVDAAPAEGLDDGDAPWEDLAA